MLAGGAVIDGEGCCWRLSWERAGLRMARSVESLVLSRRTVGEFSLRGGRSEHGRLCGTTTGGSKGWRREGVGRAPTGFVMVELTTVLGTNTSPWRVHTIT